MPGWDTLPAMIDANQSNLDQTMREWTLDDWLDALERRHPQVIELGLGRVGTVWARLAAPLPAARVITVAGTNGKGSVVAFIEAAAMACGWRVGAYTSPHLVRYNERIRIAGMEAADDDIVRGFQKIESVRGDIRLTYFEFGTLAALLLMAQAQPRLDLAILEVGLGGRLDAVNIIDADVAVVTTVALDHQDWLGDSRAAIAREKAGVARAGRPVVVGERDFDAALIQAITDIGAIPVRLGHEFDTWADGDAHRFGMAGRDAIDMPLHLPLAAPCQWENAATAITALSMLPVPDPVVPPGGSHPGADGAGSLSPDDRDVASGRATHAESTPFDLAVAVSGLAQTRLPGRLERLSTAPDVVVDVGHNPQAAAMLAEWLRGEGAGTTTDAVFSALADKDIEGIVSPMLPLIRRWYVGGLRDATPRGLVAEDLVERIQRLAALEPRLHESFSGVSISAHVSIGDALAAARSAARKDERVLAFGSFHVVAEVGKSLRAGL